MFLRRDNRKRSRAFCDQGAVIVPSKIGTNNPAGKKWDITNKCVKYTIFWLTNIALNDITGGAGRKQVQKQEPFPPGMLKWIAG
jgi:hypothetical protein